MKICVLGSGSSGNSIVVQSQTRTVLVDAGFSARRIEDRLHAVGIRPDDLFGIFVTHEHIDHIRSAGVLSRRYKLPIFATEGTLNQGKRILGKLQNVILIKPGDRIPTGDIVVSPFSVSHDAADPVAYVMASDQTRVGICTDLGFSTYLVKEKIRDCDLLVLESNHDLGMLMAGRYPWNLKQRIRSRKGHLSNDAAGELLGEVLHSGLRRVVLAHLSEENNMPELALQAVNQVIQNKVMNGSTNVTVAEQNEPSEFFRLTGDTEND